MTRRVPALANPTSQQVVLADASYALQNYDRFTIVSAADITLTLPQNPQDAEPHEAFSNGAFGFFVTGGAAFPLTVDPLYVPAGAIASFAFGTTGWQSNGTGGSGIAAGFYGDGSDGAAVMDGVATFNGFSGLVGSVYSLTRDAFLTNLTVNAGVTLNTAGFRLFVNGTLQNLGTIEHDGNAAAVAVAGAALAVGTLGLSFAGGAGSAGGGVGAAGTNATQGLRGGTGAGGVGGAATAAGGAAGTYTAMTAAQGSVRVLPQALLGVGQSQGGANTALQGGAGGGGGGSSNAGTTGGGGGGGGGVMVIAAFLLRNSGAIRSAGGAGAAGVGADDGGGGGGGGGGDIILVTRQNQGAGTVTAPGGAPGAGVNAGNPGVIGAAGNIILLSA